MLFKNEVYMVFVRAKVGPPNYGDPESMFTVQYFDELANMTILLFLRQVLIQNAKSNH